MTALVWLLFLFGLVHSEYTWYPSNNDVVEARFWHSSVFDPTREVVLVYGGQNNIAEVAYGDLWAFNLNVNNWTLMPTYNTPFGRYGHTAVVVGGNMIVVGGVNITAFVMDVWSLSLDTLVWEYMFELAFPLVGHSAVTSDTGVIYIFGGFSDETCSDNLYKLDKGEWSLVNTSGPSLCQHSAVLVDDVMWIFGGQDDTLSPTNTLYQYSIASNSWKAYNSTVPPRYGHSSVLTPRGDSMLVLGGRDASDFLEDAWEFVFDTKQWQLIQPNGSQPSRRSHHSATIVRSASLQNFMFIFGGVSSLGPKSDCYQLDVGMLPAVEAGTLAPENNVVLLFAAQDSPNNILIPIDPCTHELRNELYLSSKFIDIREIDLMGNTVRTVIFPQSGFSLVQGSFNKTLVQQFNFTSATPNCVIGVDFSLFSNETYISYGDVTLRNLPGTNKWNVNLSGWSFANASNRLELRVQLSVDDTVQVVTSISEGEEIPSQRSTQYVLYTTSTRLIIDLADFVIIDGSSYGVALHRFEGDNRLVLNFPYFELNLSYDPNFGLLLGNFENGDNQCSTRSSILWIASLITAAVVIPLLLLIGALVYYLHQRKKAAQRALVQARIRAFTKVEEERAKAARLIIKLEDIPDVL